jgi:hypothetical protein
LADYELWLAMHDDCPWPGCGECVFMDIEFEKPLLAAVHAAAHHLGQPWDVVLMDWIHEGAREVLARHQILT